MTAPILPPEYFTMRDDVAVILGDGFRERMDIETGRIFDKAQSEGVDYLTACAALRKAARSSFDDMALQAGLAELVQMTRQNARRCGGEDVDRAEFAVLSGHSLDRVRVRKRVNGSCVYIWFRCPGCARTHQIRVSGIDAGPLWQWNGDRRAVTVSPSIKVGPAKIDDDRFIGGVLHCHSFIEAGKIRFLNDCTHSLKGQTVDLPIYERIGAEND